MKTLHVFSLLLCFAVLSCTKTNNISPDSTTNYLGDADYYALIVGKWQLVEVGTGESSVCQGGHIHIATSWTKRQTATS